MIVVTAAPVATLVIQVDGEEYARLEMPRTAPFAFTARETFDVTCAAVPCRDDELCAEGMSGGAVVEIDANEGVDRFALVGLSSKQWAEQGVIARIALIPARTVFAIVRRLLQQSDEH